MIKNEICASQYCSLLTWGLEPRAAERMNVRASAPAKYYRRPANPVFGGVERGQPRMHRPGYNDKKAVNSPTLQSWGGLIFQSQTRPNMAPVYKFAIIQLQPKVSVTVTQSFVLLRKSKNSLLCCTFLLKFLAMHA